MRTQLAKTLKVLIILLIPILVIVGAASLLATDRYLAFEYGKAGFPPDPFGFTQQQRFDLASSNIHYVRAHLPSDTLTNQTLDGGAVYNTREVSHMADVQAVFQSVLRAWRVTFILLLLMGFILWQKRERRILGSAIQWGGLLTTSIVIFIGLLRFLHGSPGLVHSTCFSSNQDHGSSLTRIPSFAFFRWNSGLMQP